MDHSRVEQKYSQILEKLHILVDKQQVAQDEINLLKRENEELRGQLSDRNEHLKTFQNQEKISKIVSNVSGDEEKKTELKLKINEYIKEIDKCIAHLNQ